MVTTQSTQTRTTAPVLKFTCLYTHDLKRKHKRWQDGRLEFHTFNRRVMVYDDGGNFVGDTHRTKSHDVGDGDEFQLDRGNVIVQVAERVGQRDQDITEIFSRKPKAQENSTRTFQGLLTPRVKPSASNPQMRHLPLQSLLSTPGRQIGRAVIPSVSPFERRNQTPGEADHQPKRRRLDTPSTNIQPAATVLVDVASSPPRQPTTPVAQEAPKRKRFSPPRARNPGTAAPTTPSDVARSDTSTRISNPARPKNTNLTSCLQRAERSAPRQSNATPITECHQPLDPPLDRSTHTAKFKAPAMKKVIPLDKENQATVAQRGKDDVPSDGRPPPASNLVSKVAQIDEPAGSKVPEEPTTALRLGSAQKRGLLVAKAPSVRGKRREETPARRANGKAHPRSGEPNEANPTATADSAPVTNMAPPKSKSSLPAAAGKGGGGQLGKTAKPSTGAAVRGGPWSREAGDLLDYRPSAADKLGT